ncbi:MAG: NUDIX domain-containing protein [Dysgonamonadaceae bacterium]|jgi:NADH pyrophosphatase NudC (nudix superfamily)|nr:NUDIX domain-containing protein [Dysgonamonadaceae bacterium]
MAHLLSLFKFCPKCGSPRFVENDFKSKKCESCGFIYYFNVSASTAVFLTDKYNRLVVAKRAKEPAKGTLDLPGGFVDPYETVEEAVKREIKEETGLKIDRIQYLFSLPNTYLYSGFEVHTADLFFQCRLDEISNLQAADDVEELFLLEQENIQPELFGLDSIRKAIGMWLQKQ